MTDARLARRPAGWRGIAVRAEDWLLAGWVVLAAPILALSAVDSGPFDSGHPVAGLLECVGFVGALACLATRSPDPAGSPGPAADSHGQPAVSSGTRFNVLDSGAIGPLVGGLLLVGMSAFAAFGLDPIAMFYPTIVAVLVISVAQSRLPVVPTAARRALATPYLLCAGGIFWSIVHSVIDGGDFRAQVSASPAGASSAGAGVIGLLILCAAVYYAMLIYAPRQIAEREGSPLDWLARFGLFVVSVGLGLGWLSLLFG